MDARPRRPRPAALTSRFAAVLLAGAVAAPLSAAIAPAQGATQNASTGTDSLARPIPTDSAVIVGTLPNGMRYYIRQNPKPEQRAELRLVVDAGSVLEDSTQRGLAHFVEHMAFNGTKHFPKQAIVDYLERAGMRFGADLNASTGFDETIYELTVPTDSAQALEKGIQIMQDWASAVTFDPDEIRKERGVVIEEWRLGRGANQRIFDKQFPVLFAGSRYAQRLPIGDLHTLQMFADSSLRQFYDEWYHPDLMAVVAVGDFDPARVRALIERYMGAIPKPAASTVRPLYPVPDADRPAVTIATDPEATQSRVSVYYKLPLRRDSTVGDYRRGLVDALYDGMLNQRLDEIARRPDAPFLAASAGHGQLIRTKAAYALNALVRDGGIARGLEALLTESARVFRHGFTATELERQKAEMLRGMEEAYAERAKTNSGAFVSQYVANFLQHEPIPSIAQEYALYQKLLPGITLDEVNAEAQHELGGTSPVVLASAPQKAGVSVPSEGELLAVFDRVAHATVAAYSDSVSTAPLVPHEPTAGRVVAERKIPSVGVTEWRLSNGVRVLLKPTDFKDDEILFRAWSPGGTSLAPDSLLVPAETADGAVAVSGVGDLSAVALQKRLAGKAVNVGPSVGELDEGMHGNASPKDVETMFQLVYLYFTAPRADSAAFDAYRDRIKAFLANRSASPGAAFADTLAVTLAQHNPRRLPFTSATADQMNLARSLAFYRDRFADASDFTFLFVGNIDTTAFRPLVERWLGGLPSTHRTERWRDIGVRYPTGVVRREVHKGVDPKSQTQIVFTGPFPFTRENVTLIDALSDVLEIRLRDRLREDLGGTYGVSVSAGPQRYPVERYALTISFGSAPDRVDELTKATFAAIDSLRRVGPTPAELAKVKETELRERETNMRRNGFWLSVLSSYDQNHWDPAGILAYPKAIGKLDAAAIRDAARRWLNESNYVQVSLFPEAKHP